MSTPDQPDTPQLTRKQIRELRNTGSTPVVPSSDTESSPVEAEPRPAAPLPRPAEPSVVPPAPVSDASVDLGVSPLTRRQARQQERIRTASVPVITPDILAAHATDAPVEAVDQGLADAADESAFSDAPDLEALIVDAPVEEAPEQRRIVNPKLGAGLLAGEPVAVELPPSFDQLIARGSTATGSASAPNALVLSQDPAASPLGAVTSTGDIIITGTFALPEGLGSSGHAPGVTDGKEADAVLIDGELPASSSPTPIAASAAISTVKTAGEIIRPPAPEKGSKLLLTLAITAGALALALVAALIVAVSSGVFS